MPSVSDLLFLDNSCLFFKTPGFTELGTCSQKKREEIWSHMLRVKILQLMVFSQTMGRKGLRIFLQHEIFSPCHLKQQNPLKANDSLLQEFIHRLIQDHI